MSHTSSSSSAVLRADQGLGQLVAPSLVLRLQGAELGEGVGPPPRPRPAVLRALERPDGFAGGAALAVMGTGLLYAVT